MSTSSLIRPSYLTRAAIWKKFITALFASLLCFFVVLFITCFRLDTLVLYRYQWEKNCSKPPWEGFGKKPLQRVFIVLGFSWNISLHLFMKSFFFFTSMIPLTFCVIICNWSFSLVTGPSMLGWQADCNFKLGKCKQSLLVKAGEQMLQRKKHYCPAKWVS